jgi:hypothetical protein
MVKGLGVSYNVFDGEELLRAAVTNVRECGADYVNVVWQRFSYFGERASDHLEDLLGDLVRGDIEVVENLFGIDIEGDPVPRGEAAPAHRAFGLPYDVLACARYLLAPPRRKAYF